MTSELFYETRDEYLYVKPIGKRRSLLEAIEGSKNIHTLADKYKTNKVLADYTEMYFQVPIAEAFNLVRFYEQRLPQMNQVYLSVIVNEESYEIAKFWENVCQKRGFNNAVFMNEEDAIAWLLRSGDSATS